MVGGVYCSSRWTSSIILYSVYPPFILQSTDGILWWVYVEYITSRVVQQHMYIELGCSTWDLSLIFVDLCRGERATVGTAACRADQT